MNWSNFLVCADLVVHVIDETDWIIHFSFDTDGCHVTSVTNRSIRTCYWLFYKLRCLQLLLTLLVSPVGSFILFVLGFETLEISIKARPLVDVHVMVSVNEKIHSFQKFHEFFVLVELLNRFRLLNSKRWIRLLLGHKRKFAWLWATIFAWLAVTLVLSTSTF